ncbi:tectonic-1-like [Ischnura elegans]|uniref:tectonic-1-like n=1 Tax=Ischnura elegans TaxID=197161 RepID=UPI001ED87AC3|nr:tectonic-1-like [Ischnura elegans]
MDLKIITFLCELLFVSNQVEGEVLFLPINWTEVARMRSSQNNDFVRIFEESTISTCDLTAHSCDVDCCIDSDCTAEQWQISNCSPMDYGESDFLSLTDSSCCRSMDRSTYFYVHANNSAVLGFKYEDVGKVEDIEGFEKILLGGNHQLFAKKTSLKLGKEEESLSLYERGTNIQIYEDETAEILPMALPYPLIGTSFCTATTSIQFLVDKSWSCTWSVTAEECEAAFSPFHLLQYMFQSGNESFWSAFEKPPPRIVKNISKKNLADSSVVLNCYKNGSDYIVTSSNFLGLKTGDMIECDDFNNILSTSYDKVDGICLNVVMGVELEFFWKGSEIVKLNARYALVDIPILSGNDSLENSVNRSQMSHHQKRLVYKQKSGVLINQTFKVTFRLYKDGKDSTPVMPVDVIMRSGNPGYLIGRPLISGILRVDPIGFNPDATVDIQSVSWEDYPLEIWNGGGECRAGRPILFGYNAHSTCVLRISGRKFENCSALRDVVLATQMSLVRARWAARGGDRVNLTSADTLLPILFDHGKDWDEENNSVSICVGLPTHLSIHVLHDGILPEGRSSHFPASYFLMGVAVRFESSSMYLKLENHSTIADDIILTSSVTFTGIPSAEERSQKRFWVEKKKSWFSSIEVSKLSNSSLAIVTSSILLIAFLLYHFATRGCNRMI